MDEYSKKRRIEIENEIKTMRNGHLLPENVIAAYERATTSSLDRYDRDIDQIEEELRQKQERHEEKMRQIETRGRQRMKEINTYFWYFIITLLAVMASLYIVAVY